MMLLQITDTHHERKKGRRDPVINFPAVLEEEFKYNSKQRKHFLFLLCLRFVENKTSATTTTKNTKTQNYSAVKSKTSEEKPKAYPVGREILVTSLKSFCLSVRTWLRRPSLMQNILKRRKKKKRKRWKKWKCYVFLQFSWRESWKKKKARGEMWGRQVPCQSPCPGEREAGGLTRHRIKLSRGPAFSIHLCLPSIATRSQSRLGEAERLRKATLRLKEPMD